MRRSIVNDFGRIEVFLGDGIDALGKVPQTIDEISEAAQKHASFAEQFPEVCLTVCDFQFLYFYTMFCLFGGTLAEASEVLVIDDLFVYKIYLI